LAISGVGLLNAVAARTKPQDVAPTISVSCKINAEEVQLTMAFGNPASIDTSVYLGVIVANGKKYLPDEVSAEAKESRSMALGMGISIAVAPSIGRLR
jgi:hypothetical protein